MEEEVINLARRDRDFLKFKSQHCISGILPCLCFYLNGYEGDRGTNIVKNYHGFLIKFDFDWDCTFCAYNIEIITPEEYEEFFEGKEEYEYN